MLELNRYCEESFYEHFIRFFRDMRNLAINATGVSSEYNAKGRLWGYTHKEDKKVTEAQQVLEMAMGRFIRVLSKLRQEVYDRDSVLNLCESYGLARGLEGIEDPLALELKIITGMLSKFSKTLLDPDENPWLKSQHDKVRLFILEHAGKGLADSEQLLKDLLHKEKQKVFDDLRKLKVVEGSAEHKITAEETGVLGEVSGRMEERKEVVSKARGSASANDAEISELEAELKRRETTRFKEPQRETARQPQPFSSKKRVRGIAGDYDAMVNAIITARDERMNWVNGEDKGTTFDSNA